MEWIEMRKLVIRSFAVGIVLACLSGCKPSADFTVAPASGTAPLSVAFTNLSTGGGPFAVTWEWDFGDGTSLSSEQAPSHVYITPGSYAVTLRMSTWQGKGEVTKPAAVVVSAVGPTADFDAAPRTGTAPVEVQLTDASVAGTDAITGWLWEFGDGLTSDQQNPNHTYTAAGGYTVKLTVTAGTLTATATKAGFITVSPGQPGTPALTRTFSSAQYVPGATLDVTLTVDYPAANMTALGITEQIPANWTFQGVVGGTSPSLAHIDPGTGALELLYVTIPAFPFGVTYRLLAPADAAGTQNFSGQVLYRTDGPQLETDPVVSTINAQPTVEGEGEGEGEVEGEGEGEGEDEIEGHVVDGVYSADFSNGDHGWVAGFADLPADYDVTYWQLESGLRTIPLQSLAAISALYLAGYNHNDDLFMYYKRRVTGLTPNTQYRAEFQVDFLSPYPQGTGARFGAADFVYLKAGATTTEPATVTVGEDWLAMNIDKGNGITAGQDAVVLGTAAKPEMGSDNYVPLSEQSTENFPVTTDEEGGAWLYFGTDSAQTSATGLYFSAFRASFSLYTPPVQASADVFTVKHTLSTGDTYTPGQDLDVTLYVDHVGTGPVTMLGATDFPPAGWTFKGYISGPFPEISALRTVGPPMFVWQQFVPRTPFTLTYRVAVPSGETGIRAVSSYLLYRTNSGGETSNEDLVHLRSTESGDTFISLTRAVGTPCIYYPGQPVDITVRFDKHGDQIVYGLAGTESFPLDWTVQGVDGASPPIWKVLSGGGGVEYGWVTVPSFPVEFTYHLLPPADASGMVQIAGLGLYRFSGPQLETNADAAFMVPGMIR
jgi:PKD repeat protein